MVAITQLTQQVHYAPQFRCLRMYLRLHTSDLTDGNAVPRLHKRIGRRQLLYILGVLGGGGIRGGGLEVRVRSHEISCDNVIPSLETFLTSSGKKHSKISTIGEFWLGTRRPGGPSLTSP
jgi:hypothetical protein